MTLPEFRGLGIYTGVLETIWQDARKAGLTVAEAIVLEGNEASMKAFRNAGFRPVARVAGIKIFGITFTWRRKLEEGEG